MEDERFWTKVSGCERVSRLGPPYADAAPFARKLVSCFPSRTLWGTDWPHPHMDHAIPDDGDLADLLSEIAPNEAECNRLRTLRKKLGHRRDCIQTVPKAGYRYVWSATSGEPSRPIE
jgi:predicted TIM-barrel fold metal-dependent hydrolase